MTKLTLLAVLGLIYLSVLRLAYFFMAVFIILFFGMTTWWVVHVSVPGAIALIAFLALYFGAAATIFAVVSTRHAGAGATWAFDVTCLPLQHPRPATSFSSSSRVIYTGWLQQA